MPVAGVLTASELLLLCILFLSSGLFSLHSLHLVVLPLLFILQIAFIALLLGGIHDILHILRHLLRLGRFGLRLSFDPRLLLLTVYDRRMLIPAFILLDVQPVIVIIQAHLLRVARESHGILSLLQVRLAGVRVGERERRGVPDASD